jgi:dienelactone hydrolase
MGVEGVSRGAELALQLGSMYPILKAVVAYSPSDVLNRACCGMTPVPWAWTWKGHGLALKQKIQVEQTQGPILLISGDSDGIWESSSMAESMVRRLKEKKFGFPVTHLRYAHAGHGVGHPELTPAWVGVTRNPTSGRETEPGGTAKGNGEASLDAPPRVLEFLSRSLGPR